MGCRNITTNVNGIPYLSTTNVTVSDTAVDLALGFRSIAPIGFFTVRITTAVPADATGTLPVTLTLNGVSRPLTLLNGTPATASDITGTGALFVFNDRLNGILQLISRTTV